MKALVLAAAAALLVAGCGTHYTKPASPYPPSSVTPDGAKPEPPPAQLGAASSSIHISGNGLLLIERFEGFSSCPYYDSVGTGHPWTRGFGETEGITRYSPCISVRQGTANLRVLIETRYQWAVRGMGVAFNQNQVDALDSFAWNLGAGIFTGSLRWDLQHHYFYAAAELMRRYVYAGGVILQGLVTRRNAEMALFLKPGPKPVPAETRAQKIRHLHTLEGEQIRLRRYLLTHGCRSRRQHHQTIGPKCRRAFVRGDLVGAAVVRYRHELGR